MLNNTIRRIFGTAAAVSALMLAAPAGAEASDVDLPRKELKELDNAMRRAPFFEKMKNQRLDSLKHRLALLDDAKGKWSVAYELNQQYMTTNADSALRYSRLSLMLALETGIALDEAKSRAAIIRSLAMSGIFSQALAELRSLDSISYSKSEKIELWKAGRQLYGYMVSYINTESQIYEQYRRTYFQYDDSLLANLPHSDNFYLFLSGERAVADGRYAQAKQSLSFLMNHLRPDENLYGMSAFQMAEAYRMQGEETHYASFLAKSAISDIEGVVKEGLALPTLANWLYQQGRIDNAFEYINFALEDATVSNARMRTVTIARLLPIIDQAYRREIKGSHDRLLAWFLLSVFLLMFSGVLLFYLMRQIKRSRRSQEKLAALSKMQEAYIGNFVSMCSSYSDRLDSLVKLVTVKIAAGQTEELVKQIKSGRYGDNKDEDFYKQFDSAFLDLYPDFISQFNSLLREDERVELKKGQGLSPELRIYAFVKLGVDESTRIAQVLHYSVSTIYAYRNKMRNKAIDRDNFEASVKELGR